MNKRGARQRRGGARIAETPGLVASSMETLATLGTTATLGPLLPQATVDAIEATALQVFTEYRPSPTNFAEYLPWACHQLNVDAEVHVYKILQSAYMSCTSTSEPREVKKSRKNKCRSVEPQRSAVSTDSESIYKFIRKRPVRGLYGTQVDVIAEYDSNNTLHHLKFINNAKIPQGVLQIVNMIAHFHPQMRAVTLCRGLDKQLLYQICRLQALANITELCIEHCNLKEGCYYVLLESQKHLKYFSLRRCGIDDDILEAISARLLTPYNASKTLRVLDLSSNSITDEGAKSLAEVLRTNRRLCYLSLMNNMIGDKGAMELLDKLAPFPLRPEEYTNVMLGRAHFIAYKSALIVRGISDIKAKEVDNRRIVKRLLPSPRFKTRKTSKDSDLSRKRSSDRNSCTSLRGGLYDKAKASVDFVVGDFRHAYSEQNTVHTADGLYCRGNNTLNYLNLAYNNLSELTLRRLAKVVEAQGTAMRGGLLSVNLDGNPMPQDCQDLVDVDETLKVRLASLVVGWLGSGGGKVFKSKNPR